MVKLLPVVLAAAIFALVLVASQPGLLAVGPCPITVGTTCPPVEIKITFAYGVSGKTVSFVSDVVGEAYAVGPTTTFRWDFGDGERSAEQNPVHTYKAFGAYLVELTITDTANPVFPGGVYGYKQAELILTEDTPQTPPPPPSDDTQRPPPAPGQAPPPPAPKSDLEREALLRSPIFYGILGVIVVIVALVIFRKRF